MSRKITENKGRTIAGCGDGREACAREDSVTPKCEELGIIYCAYDESDNTGYVGQTVMPLKQRRRSHFNAGVRFFEGREEYATPFDQIYAQKGEDAFEWIVLAKVAISRLDEYEKYWIKYFEEVLCVELYNKAPGGSGFRGTFDPEDIKNILEAYEQGSSITAVARQYNVAPNTIRRILTLNNIEIRDIKTQQSLYLTDYKITRCAQNDYPEHVFSNLTEAAHWLYDNYPDIQATFDSVKRAIIASAEKGTKSYGFYWLSSRWSESELVALRKKLREQREIKQRERSTQKKQALAKEKELAKELAKQIRSTAEGNQLTQHFKLCPCCNEQIILSSSTCCSICLGQKHSKIHIEDYDALLLKIADASFTDVAKDMGITSTALQKHLKERGHLHRRKEINEYAEQRRNGKIPEECHVQKQPDRITKDQYPLLYKEYCETHNLQEVAKHFSCDFETVKKACLANGIREHEFMEFHKQKYHKQIIQFDLETHDVLNVFPSIAAASRWIFENADNRPKTLKAAATEIGLACNGTHKTAYGYKWEFANN